MSIRAYLLLLLGATLVPMLALSGVLAWYYGDAARRTIDSTDSTAARRLESAISRLRSGLVSGE